MFTKYAQLLEQIRNNFTAEGVINALTQTYHNCYAALTHRAPVTIEVDGAKEHVPDRIIHGDGTQVVDYTQIYAPLNVVNHSAYYDNTTNTYHNGTTLNVVGVVNIQTSNYVTNNSTSFYNEHNIVLTIINATALIENIYTTNIYDITGVTVITISNTTVTINNLTVTTINVTTLGTTGNLTVGGTLIVTGAVTFNSTLIVALGVTFQSTLNLQGALTYGGVTLSNSVTGTGSMVLSANQTLTGTLTGAAANFSGAIAYGTLTGLTISPITSMRLDSGNLQFKKTTITNGVVGSEDANWTTVSGWSTTTQSYVTDVDYNTGTGVLKETKHTARVFSSSSDGDTTIDTAAAC